MSWAPVFQYTLPCCYGSGIIKSMKMRSGDCGLCVKCVKFIGVVHGVGGASEEGRYQTNLSTASNASNILERDSFRLELFKQNIKCLK